MSKHTKKESERTFGKGRYKRIMSKSLDSVCKEFSDAMLAKFNELKESQFIGKYVKGNLAVVHKQSEFMSNNETNEFHIEGTIIDMVAQVTTIPEISNYIGFKLDTMDKFININEYHLTIYDEKPVIDYLFTINQIRAIPDNFTYPFLETGSGLI
jgi:hypothetical protein